MGRFATFKNDTMNVSYKFWFACQSSGDIMNFGGTYYREFDIESWEEEEEYLDEDEKQELEKIKEWLGDDTRKEECDIPDWVKETCWFERAYHAMLWDTEEAEEALEALKEIGSEYDWALPEWKKYEATGKGWDAMYSELLKDGYKSFQTPPPHASEKARFCLGCLIYLLLSNQKMGDTLSADFEA